MCPAHSSFRLLSVALLMLGLSMRVDASPLKSFEALKWENRLIIMNNIDPENLAELAKHSEHINDRDLIWFAIDAQHIKTNFRGKLAESLQKSMRQSYARSADSRVVLIGKDGGVKSTSSKLDLASIFAKIDAMPMRQQEMRLNRP